VTVVRAFFFALSLENIRIALLLFRRLMFSAPELHFLQQTSFTALSFRSFRNNFFPLHAFAEGDNAKFTSSSGGTFGYERLKLSPN
jgi:hypothetical protein